MFYEYLKIYKIDNNFFYIEFVKKRKSFFGKDFFS